MARISDIPDEILIQIFTHFRRDPTSKPSSLVLVCRKLLQPANEILYQHVRLLRKLSPNCSLARFSNTSPRLEFVRSLRLDTSRGLSAFALRMPAAWANLDPLCTTLSHLSKLKTFSISLQVNTYRSHKLPPSVIVRILDTLPPSVVNLELDTAVADSLGDTSYHDELKSDTHLCIAIAKLLPRLQRFSLRVASLCANILPAFDPSNGIQPKSQLRTAIIKLAFEDVVRHGTAHVHICGQHARTPFRAASLWVPLLNLQAAGAFPHLQRFLLLGANEEKTIHVRDVATRSTTAFSVKFCRELNGSPLQTCGLQGYKEWHLVQDHHGLDWYGRYEDVERAIECGAGWEQRYQGSSFPRYLTALESTPLLDTSVLWSKDKILEELEKCALPDTVERPNIDVGDGLDKVAVWHE